MPEGTDIGGPTVVDNHYAHFEAPNMKGVLVIVSEDQFERAKQHLGMIGHADPERYIGRVIDKSPTYYHFTGNAYFMRHGVAQVGRAVTTATQGGFDMIRLFTRNPHAAQALQNEVFVS